MGAIHFRRIELVTSLNELVGYKAGVALTREQMQGLVQTDEADLLVGHDDSMLRVRSEHFDDLLCQLLYAVGNIRCPDIMSNYLQMFHRVKKAKRLFPIYLKLGEA